MILGIDEVGRGPWAGPLVVGAVVLGEAQIEGLTDSKKLSKKRRDTLNEEIIEKAAGYGLGWVSSEELDEIGLSKALVTATKRAVEQVEAPYHEIIIDGTINFLKETSKGQYVTTLAKADLLIPSVSAASIIAKVARDNYMAEQDGLYQGYGFGSHVGYGTKKHRDAIELLGVTPLHRLSFAPLQKYATKPREVITDVSLAPKVTSKSTGDYAENLVADYLVDSGHVVLARNWRTRLCEIDIVSRKADTVYFTEVKYRRQANQGGGIAAITPKKLQQMKFAADYFVQTHSLQGHNLLLAAATVSGEPPILDEYIELK